MLRNLLLLIAAVAGGVIGYFVGSFSLGEAKQALQMEQQVSAQVKRESELAQKSLQEKMTGLASEHKASIDGINRDKSEALAQLDAEKKGRAAAIQQANATKAALDKKFAELKKLSSDPSLSQADKKSVQADMGKVAADSDVQKLRASGLECLSVLLPQETLEKFVVKVP